MTNRCFPKRRCTRTQCNKEENDPDHLEQSSSRRRDEQRLATEAIRQPSRTYVASRLEKRKVEASTKQLSQHELRQLGHAKQNEIRQYLQNAVMEVLQGHERIGSDELMGMRCVVTVKHFLLKRVKARLVILGSQAGDLEDALLQAATQTLCARHVGSLLARKSARN